MFITENRDGYQFVDVKNGNITTREFISSSYADNLIRKHNLVRMSCGIFRNAYTYRDAESAMLVNSLLVSES